MIKPMLANEIPGRIAAAMASDDWVAQLKADGHRLVVQVIDGAVAVVGRNGQTKQGVPSWLRSAFTAFAVGEWTFDGELVDGRYLIFDMIRAGGHLTDASPFSERYQTLSTVMATWQPNADHIALLPVVRGAEKAVFLADARMTDREGIILRRLSGRYRMGVRSDDVLKVKFVSEVDCEITAVKLRGSDGRTHNNVELTVYDDGREVKIGRASANGKNPTPQVGQVWSVRFLNAGDDPASPRLYQPRLVAKRDDKAPSECHLSQLDGAYTDKDLSAIR